MQNMIFDSHSIAPWTLPEAFQELPAEVATTLIGQLVEPFQTDTAARLQRARTAIAEANLAVLRAEVHSMKGSAGQIGADAMSSVCAEMELAIGHVPLSQLLESLKTLELYLSSSLHAMKDYCSAAQRADNQR
jgi:HPt (histidine-containing phosphotransfer) domain-containing protein